MQASISDSDPELDQNWVFDMNSRNLLNATFDN